MLLFIQLIWFSHYIAYIMCVCNFAYVSMYTYICIYITCMKLTIGAYSSYRDMTEMICKKLEIFIHIMHLQPELTMTSSLLSLGFMKRMNVNITIIWYWFNLPIQPGPYVMRCITIMKWKSLYFFLFMYQAWTHVHGVAINTHLFYSI